jgi:hypothetical protein
LAIIYIERGKEEILYVKLIVAVHFNSRPISSDAADKYANSILEAWNPAEKGTEASRRKYYIF